MPGSRSNSYSSPNRSNSSRKRTVSGAARPGTKSGGINWPGAKKSSKQVSPRAHQISKLAKDSAGNVLNTLHRASQKNRAKRTGK